MLTTKPRRGFTHQTNHPFLVNDDKAGILFLGGPRRREAAGGHGLKDQRFDLTNKKNGLARCYSVFMSEVSIEADGIDAFVSTTVCASPSAVNRTPRKPELGFH